MILVDVPSEEMIKDGANAFLSAKISFINAIANICELAGADVTQVMKGMGLDPRIGPAFLSAGLRFGGSCFPQEPDLLVAPPATPLYHLSHLPAGGESNRQRAGTLRRMMEKHIIP